MRLFFIFLLLSACTSPTKKLVQRLPSSLLLEERVIEQNFLLYSGQSMPQEIVVAKSLPKAPLLVEVQTPSAEVHCRHSSNRKEGTVFRLEPNHKGSYDHISCSLDHDGGKRPRSHQVTLKFRVLLDEFEVSDDEYLTKKQLMDYRDILTDGKEWPEKMVTHLAHQINSSVAYISSQDDGVQKIWEVRDGSLGFISIEGFEQSFTAKKFLGKGRITAAGTKRHAQTRYPYNEKAVVCGEGGNNELIDKVLLAEGSLGQLRGLKGPFNCQINYRTNDKNVIKNHSGSIALTYRAASYDQLLKILDANITFEDTQITRRIKTYHSDEVNRLAQNNREILSRQQEIEIELRTVLGQIAREEFVAFKDQTIGNLFPEEARGQIARSSNAFQITPVKKIVYNESGDMKSILYLQIKNSLHYKIETSAFQLGVERSLPFEEQVNLYIATSDTFNDQDGKQLIVCNDDLKKFYLALGKVQKDINQGSVSYDRILRGLQATARDSVIDCRLGNEEKKAIAFTRGTGKKDYLIQWKKSPSGNGEALHPVAVGNTYHSQVFDTKITHDYLRDKGHPVFNKNFDRKVKKNSLDHLWDAEKKLVIERMDDETFIQIAF